MGRFNRTPDTELKVAASTAITTTASTTAVNILSIGAGEEDLGLMLDVTAVAGTFDASNYYTVELLASETSGGTYYPVTNDIVNVVGAKLVAFNTRQVVDAVGSSNAAYYKLAVTKVGSTATGVTLSAYIVKGA
jgi:hypothetical protein